MPTLTSNMWKGDVNTKVPALSHYFTFRVTGFNPVASANYALPGNYNLLGQYTPAQAPTNFAPTSSPYDVNSEPQFLGAVFVPTQLSIRNANGPFVGSGGTPAGNSLVLGLYNSNIASYNATTGVVTRAAASAPSAVNTYVQTSWTAATALQPWTQESIWSASIPGQPTATVTAANQVTTAPTMSETSTAAPGFSVAPVRFGLGDQLAISATYTAGTAPSVAPTATQFTVDVFGYWLQGF